MRVRVAFLIVVQCRQPSIQSRRELKAICLGFVFSKFIFKKSTIPCGFQQMLRHSVEIY